MIDARGLHEWLGHKRMFANWIADRIRDYGFVEGEDYLTKMLKTGGRPRTEYLLTVGMAKELAMVERSQIGQLTRRYFIEMEQAASARMRPPPFEESLNAMWRKWLGDGQRPALPLRRRSFRHSERGEAGRHDRLPNSPT